MKSVAPALHRALLVAAVLAAAVGVGLPAGADSSISIGPDAWRVVERDSGPVNYYSIVTEGDRRFVRASYRPPLETVVLGWQAPESARGRARKLSFDWRARTLPKGGDECTPGRGDSAAVVYVTWRRGLRYYTLKYVWSAVSEKGSVCDQKRNPFVAQDTVVLRSGPPLDTWQRVELDLKSEFRRHFEGGDPAADVPDFMGVGIMSDGDQTGTPSSADYAAFRLEL